MTKKKKPDDGVLDMSHYTATRNHYKCPECETSYYTPENKPPPSPRWDDGHVCNMVLISNKDE